VRVDPLNEFGLLGPLAVACERRDADAVVAQATLLRAAWPEWQGRTVIVQSLSHDRSYRFVRNTLGLFERAFGVSVDSLYGG
jgi:hypothetical protein